MNDELAAMISAAPRKSSLCGRSCRGRRRSSVSVSTIASRPSGMFIQKITDQCRYSAMTPPSAGPQAPAVV